MARTTTRDFTPAAPTPLRRGYLCRHLMAEEVRLFGRYVKRQTVALWLLGVPAMIPIALTIRPPDAQRHRPGR